MGSLIHGNAREYSLGGRKRTASMVDERLIPERRSLIPASANNRKLGVD